MNVYDLLSDRLLNIFHNVLVLNQISQFKIYIKPSLNSHGMQVVPCNTHQVSNSYFDVWRMNKSKVLYLEVGL